MGSLTRMTLIAGLWLVSSPATSTTFDQITNSSDSNWFHYGYFSPDGTKITYSATQLFIANADGTGFRQLTSSTGNPSTAGSLSRDGGLVAFESGANLTGASDFTYSQIFTINGDGTGLRQLTSAQYGAYKPALSEDGSRVVFISHDGFSDVNVINNVNNGGVDEIRLARCTAGNILALALSRDGSRVAFGCNGDPVGGNSDKSPEIFLVNIDGSGLRQLTNNIKSVSYYWDAINSISIAPGGNLIAFDYVVNPSGGSVDDVDSYLISSDGSGMRLLVSAAPNSSRPVLTGTDRVIFSSTWNRNGANPDESLEAFLIERDGTGITQITSSSDETYATDISTDGTQVVLISRADFIGSNSDHSREVYVAQNLPSQGSNTDAGDLETDESGGGGAVGLDLILVLLATLGWRQRQRAPIRILRLPQ